MQTKEGWGQRSFDLVWPEQEVVCVHETDSAEKIEMNLNFVEASLGYERTLTERQAKQSESTFLLWGTLCGTAAVLTSCAIMDFGLSSPSTWLGICSMAVLGVASARARKYSKMYETALCELDEEQSKLVDTRRLVEHQQVR